MIFLTPELLSDLALVDVRRCYTGFPHIPYDTMLGKKACYNKCIYTLKDKKNLKKKKRISKFLSTFEMATCYT